MEIAGERVGESSVFHKSAKMAVREAMAEVRSA